MKFVTVSVMRRARSQNWLAYWSDPSTGRKRTRSLKTTDERTAIRMSQRIQTAINSGESIDEGPTWENAVEAFKDDTFPSLSPASRADTLTTIKFLNVFVRPKSLAALNESAISNFAAQLRSTEIRGKLRSEATIRRYLAQVKRMLRWFHDAGYINRVPRIRMPPATGAKGRPLTDAEFQAMKNAVPLVVGLNTERVRSWTELLEGLWLSGLRLGEALRLTWDNPFSIRVDLDGHQRPMLIFPGAFQKNRQDQIVPITPDFADWLRDRQDPTGFVFQPLCQGLDERVDRLWASRLISRIGEKAGIVVKETFAESGKKTDHFATAHDLRRSFGARWARKVLPPVLRELMRHSDIKTTLDYYAGRNAESLAESLYSQIEAKNQQGGETATRQTGTDVSH